MPLFYFACSRLWIFDFDLSDYDYKPDLKHLEQIRFIERSHAALHSLSLKPLPKAFDDLQYRAMKSNPKEVICAHSTDIFTQSLLFSESFGKWSL